MAISRAKSKEASDVSRQPAQPVQRSEEQAREGVVSILIVDDEREVCRFLQRVLADPGYEVETCTSGEEAMARMAQHAFNLVITDLRLPGVNGLEVLRKAKELDPYCEVMVITAYASVESALEAMKSGAYDYIAKPFNVDEIKLVVAKALEKQGLAHAAEERDFYRHLSRIDGLTEVYNYRALYEMLEAELQRSIRHQRSVSVLMIDVDDLKIYNDTLGHPAGDALLKDLARTLGTLVRNCDIVARYGGDEFVIILAETNKPEAIEAAKRLNRQVQETRFDHQEVFPRKRLTISIGVATFPTDAQEAAPLVGNADRALCEGKRLGGNVVRSADEQAGESR